VFVLAATVASHVLAMSGVKNVLSVQALVNGFHTTEGQDVGNALNVAIR